MKKETPKRIQKPTIHVQLDENTQAKFNEMAAEKRWSKNKLGSVIIAEYFKNN
jgi:hypothetical protein